LKHFASTSEAVVQHRRIRRILDRRSSDALFELLAEPRADFRSALVKSALRFGVRRGEKRRGSLYLNIGHTGLNEPGFKRWVTKAGVRPIYLVHDLIPITHPRYCRPGEREKHVERMRTVLDTSAGVIGNSHATIEELHSFAILEQRRWPPAIVAPLGSDALNAASAETDETERPTFLVVGTIEARKNHIHLLRIWRRLIDRLGDRAPRLVIIGQRGWECDDVFEALDHDSTLKGSVVEIGDCDDERLQAHLRTARALLFPSLVEGYGLPLVEALRSGTPAIASDLPVFREIAGAVPDYLRPLDEAAWERAILDYSELPSAPRQAQMQRLALFRAPTWADHFAIVDNWLETF
jgi:glycosyltransferase involved in cell wall biosynthesis